MSERVPSAEEFFVACIEAKPEDDARPDARIRWQVVRKEDRKVMDGGYAPDLATAQIRGERNLRWLLRTYRARQKRGGE